MKNIPKRGFTLIELLVVIAIIAILSVVVILTLNPAELLRQSRDSNRVSDMSTLTNALGLYAEDTGGNMGVPLTTYVSIPDPSATSTAGDQCQGLGLPSLPSGDSYHCASSSTFRNVNGTGWIPLNFSSISFKTPLDVLPVDPVNTTSSEDYYTYNTDGVHYELTTISESNKYLGNCANDGGQYGDLCEGGTSLALVPEDYYLAGQPVLFLNIPKSIAGSATTTLTFSGTANEVINVGITGINSCNTNYYLLNPDGSTLKSGWSCSASLSFLNVTLPSAGIYKMVIYPYVGFSNTVTFTSVVAGNITLDTPITVSSTLSGQVTTLTFSGTANEVINVGITGINSCNTNYYLLNPDGSTLKSGWSCSISLAFPNVTLPSSGTYTLKLVPDPTKSYSNQFTLTNPIGGTITFNTPTVMSSTLSGQTSEFTFSGTASQVVNLTVTGVNSCNTNYYLLNPDGSTLKSGWSCSASLNLTSSTLPSTGTYTVSIVPYPPVNYNNTVTVGH